MVNWYKETQSLSDMFENEFLDIDNTKRHLVKEEEKIEPRIIHLYRNFDASMNNIQKDSNGNLIFSPYKCEQGVLWFANDLQSNPGQYYKDRGGQYLLTIPLKVQYHYIEKTYDNGDIIKEPISDFNDGFENSSTWAGYTLPDGFKFSYKNQKHIICEKELRVPPKYITKVDNELV